MSRSRTPWAAPDQTTTGGTGDLDRITPDTEHEVTPDTDHDSEARRESERRFRTMADQLPLIVWHHGSDGRLDWVNARFCRFFGLARDDVGPTVTTQRWHYPMDPDDERGYVRALTAAVRGRQPLHIEIRVRRADGRWRWLESWMHPRFAADGCYQGHLGTSIDVTDRKVAEAALRSAATVAAFRTRLIDTLRSVGDAQQLQERACQLLGEHLGAARVHYADIDGTGRFAVVRRDYHPWLPSVAGTHRLDDYGPAAMDVFRRGETLVVDDVAHDPRLSDGERIATAALQIGAYVMVPLVRQGGVVHVLVIHHAVAHRWTTDEIDTVQETAERTWAAVEQARAESALRVKHARAELTALLLSDLEKPPTLAAKHQRLAELLVPRFADYATVEAPESNEPLRGIAHRDPDAVETLRALRTTYRASADDARAPSRTAAAEPHLIGSPTPAESARASSDPIVRALLDRLAPRAHLVVPLDLGGGVHGVLMVGVTDPQRSPYTSDDLAFLTETAQRVGVLLSATRLREEEHGIAVRLQQALLPDELIWHPSVPIEARYQAANALLEVGGDWYDTFRWPSGHVGVMVGDVVGHTLDSAAAMGRLRAATAALATSMRADPAALIGALEQFARGPDGIDFVTAVCVVVNPATGVLSYSCAGHPPVLVVPPDGPVIRLDAAQSTPLGTLTVTPRPAASLMLAPGSLVVMYTDGLIERRRENLETGLQRLERLAVSLAHRPLGVVADRLVADMAADSPPTDDVVVTCFRYTPVRARFARSMPAEGSRLAGLRAELRRWMDDLDLAPAHRDRVLLGVGEASGNVVEHAYRDRPRGGLWVELTDYGHHVTVEVRDRGTWRPAGRGGPDAGLGTQVMRALAQRFDRRTGPDGTTVTLTVPVPDIPAVEAWP